jgi:hypothetical protein
VVSHKLACVSTARLAQRSTRDENTKYFQPSSHVPLPSCGPCSPSGSTRRGRSSIQRNLPHPIGPLRRLHLREPQPLPIRRPHQRMRRRVKMRNLSAGVPFCSDHPSVLAVDVRDIIPGGDQAASSAMISPSRRGAHLAPARRSHTSVASRTQFHQRRIQATVKLPSTSQSASGIRAKVRKSCSCTLRAAGRLRAP